MVEEDEMCARNHSPFLPSSLRYERKPPCPFRSIVDTQFVGSMGPPGGGRNPVTQRFLRHFNFISFTEMSDDSVGRIFTTILGSFYRCDTEGYGVYGGMVVRAVSSL